MKTFIALPKLNITGLRQNGGPVPLLIGARVHWPAKSQKWKNLNDFLRTYGEKHLTIVVPKFPNARLYDRAAQAVTALFGAYLICWPKVQFGLEVNKSNIDAAAAIVELARWVFNCYVNNGEQYVAERLKSLATCCRYYAVAPHNQLGLPPKIPHGCPWAPNGNFDPEWLFRGSIAAKAGSLVNLLRFSRFSRALPPGAKWTEEKALASHRADVTAEPTTHASVLRLTYQVVETVTRVEGLSDGIMKPGYSLSESASLENPSRRGGAAQHLREMLWDQEYHSLPFTKLSDIEKYSTDQFDLFQFLKDIHPLHFRKPESDEGYMYDPEEELDDPSTGERLVFTAQIGLPHEQEKITTLMHKSTVVGAFGDLSDKPERVIPTHRVSAIPDRGGYKTRVVTAGPAALQSLAQNVRKILYRTVLPRTPTNWAITENGTRNFLDQLEVPEISNLGPLVLLSCDLTAATDKFPHDIVETINDAIEANLTSEAQKSPNWVAWRSLSGPQKLIYKKDKVVEEVLSSCGNMMGTAPSWFHLNMVNLSIFRISWSLWCQGWFRKRCPELYVLQDISSLKETSKVVETVLGSLVKLKNAFTFPNGLKFNKLTAIVGDDLCAICPFAVAVIYEIIMEDGNAATSPGKHFVQPVSVGNFVLLAEEFSVLNQSEELTGIVAENLRSITSLHSAAAAGENTRSNPWAHYGTLVSELVRKARPEIRKALCSYAHTLTSAPRTIQFRLGLPVYTPIDFGGLGWPHPKGFLYAIEHCTPMSFLITFSQLRGFKTDILKYVSEIQKLKSCFLSSGKSSDFSKLTDICQQLLKDVKVSRNGDGSLGLVSEEAPIGLANPDFETIPLTEFFEKFCLQGLNSRFLTDLISLNNFKETVEEVRPMKDAAARYKLAVKRLNQIRSRDVKYLANLPRSAFVAFFEEDREYLHSLHIVKSERFGHILPDLIPKDKVDAANEA